MELDRGTVNGLPVTTAETTAEGAEPVTLPFASPERTSTRIDPEEPTSVLRRCTALAARARVDLLTTRQHAASDELSQLLTVMEAWEVHALESPDPTMVVLAAAALQDLAERLPDPARALLGVRIATVLGMLHAVMDQGRVRTMA